MTNMKPRVRIATGILLFAVALLALIVWTYIWVTLTEEAGMIWWTAALGATGFVGLIAALLWAAFVFATEGS